MGTPYPPPGAQAPTLDLQVLESLETYIATEDFLHKLEQASAEWIDLSEHHPHATDNTRCNNPGEASQDVADSPVSDRLAPVVATATAAVAATDSTAGTSNTGKASRSRSGLFSWARSSSNPTQAPASSKCAAKVAQQTTRQTANNSCSTAVTASGACPASSTSSTNDLAASVFEVLEQQPPLHQDVSQQEPFVLVSADDAVEGMAYYIALYLSRAPEARYMEPKQLQAALRQTFTAIRRSRYKVVWDWARCLYRWGAVSYSALQLYEHPWLVRAVVAAIWTSSKMAFGLLV